MFKPVFWFEYFFQSGYFWSNFMQDFVAAVYKKVLKNRIDLILWPSLASDFISFQLEIRTSFVSYCNTFETETKSFYNKDWNFFLVT